MSNFSNNKPSSTAAPVFKKHHVHEVSKSLTESKYIADDYHNAHRYQHRATVTLVGYSGIRPYDPIYLDGLPNGMSGYWTVLSVKHIFGGRPANYILELEVGTDVIGDTSTTAAVNSDLRDLQGDLSGQSLTSSGSKLTQYSISVNASSINPSYGNVTPTALTHSSHVGVPTVAGSTPFKDRAPNTSIVKKTVQWVAKSSGKVVR